MEYGLIVQIELSRFKFITNLLFPILTIWGACTLYQLS